MADLRDFTGKNRKFTGDSGIITSDTDTNTAGRVDEKGRLRFNNETSLYEYYNGTEWQSIDVSPIILSFTPSSFISDGSTLTDVTVTGSSFKTGATAKFVGNDGTEYTSASVTRNSDTELIIQTVATMGVANEPYKIRVTNPSGLQSTSATGIDAGATPAWSTAAGNIAAFFDTQTGSVTVTATDADEGTSITYSLVSGSLPDNCTLNSATGVISGQPDDPGVGVTDTYTFTIRASDGINTADREFNITVTQGFDGSSTARAADHPDQIYNTGGTSGSSYYFNILGGTSQKEFARIGDSNFVALTYSDWESIGYTATGSGVSNHGWFSLSAGGGDASTDGIGSVRWFSSSGSNDYEMWNTFNTFQFNGTSGFQKYAGTVYVGSGIDSGSHGSYHPDFGGYDGYITGDPDYNSQGYNSQGSGNRSWWRWGVAGKTQIAASPGPDTYEEFGPSSASLGSGNGSIRSVVGHKRNATSSPVFASPASMYNGGTNASSYINIGTRGNHQFRFSTASESGAPPSERYCWTPWKIYIS